VIRVENLPTTLATLLPTLRAALFLRALLPLFLRYLNDEIISSGMAIAAAGVALGVGGVVALSRALEGQLHGVSPGDPVTLALLAGALLATALAAVWIPARGAARSDPMEVLREE
jgi:ABC-type antimicrobial peptide transport system permease subunit